MNTKSTLPPCPTIQSIQDKYLAPLLQAIEEGKLVNGPAMVYDADRGVFLTTVVDQGLIVSWSMVSCATKAGAANEVQRINAAVAYLASAAGRAAMVGGTADAGITKH